VALQGNPAAKPPASISETSRNKHMDMDQGPATDEIVDLIASIEMHRKGMGKESGLSAACNEALRKLHELLDREREALKGHGSGSPHSANIEAVTKEIAKVKKLAGDTTTPTDSQNPRPRHHQVSLQDGARNFPRNKGRRTMGRSGR
jgi:hypothetical protein